MKPRKILSYLVPVGKGQEDPEHVTGTEIPPTGSLFSMLAGVFENSTAECTVPIRFVTDGSQQNDVRDAIRDLLKNPTLSKGRKLAERLRDVSTGKSGLGLLFLLFGQEGEQHKIVVSRFPTDQGVLAEQKRGSLEVAFVERIFMKNAKTYKAACHRPHSELLRQNCLHPGFVDTHESFAVCAYCDRGTGDQYYSGH
jgi:hypothetical protein